MSANRFLMLLLPLALTTVGCAASSADVDDEMMSTSDNEDDPTQEGEEEVSADELKLGDANRAGFEEPTYDAQEKAEVLAKYTHIDPDGVVPRTLLENALQYYHFNKSRLANDGYLTIIDMGKHSGKERFYMVGLDSGNVSTTVVAHGSGSDRENDGLPSTFSNRNGSNASSIGYYKTAETYNGKWGYSLRLDGLSTTNADARRRAIVMHGASYVVKGKSKQGRSWGCPAVPLREKETIINKLRNGSLLYIDTSAGAESR